MSSSRPLWGANSVDNFFELENGAARSLHQVSGLRQRTRLNLAKSLSVEHKLRSVLNCQSR